MKSLRRFFTVFFGAFLLAGGALILLCANNNGIRSFWQSNLDFVLDNFWIAIATGCALVIIGIVAITVGLYLKKTVPFAKVSMGEFGQVDISLAAVDTVVKKVANAIAGVREVKTRIKSDSTGVSVLLDVVMAEDCNIPDTVTLLQQDVKAQLESIVGLTVISVKTAITNIATAK